MHSKSAGFFLLMLETSSSVDTCRKVRPPQLIFRKERETGSVSCHITSDESKRNPHPFRKEREQAVSCHITSDERKLQPMLSLATSLRMKESCNLCVGIFTHIFRKEKEKRLSLWFASLRMKESRNQAEGIQTLCHPQLPNYEVSLAKPMNGTRFVQGPIAKAHQCKSERWKGAARTEATFYQVSCILLQS